MVETNRGAEIELQEAVEVDPLLEYGSSLGFSVDQIERYRLAIKGNVELGKGRLNATVVGFAIFLSLRPDKSRLKQCALRTARLLNGIQDSFQFSFACV